MSTQIARHESASYDVVWKTDTRGTHFVIYGAEVHKFPKHEDLAAAHAYGECVRHAAECSGCFGRAPRNAAT